MAKEFTKNMFIMLLSIMIGVIIITYFIGDIIARSKIDTLTAEHKEEIVTIMGQSENFTSHFLKSSGVLDQAREDRAFGNYHFDLGLLWYQSALSQKNSTMMELYKLRGIDNCTKAFPNYLNSNLNFLDAKVYFNETKIFISYTKYLNLLDLYVNLTDAGSRLTMLRYDASKYLMYLTENLTYNPDSNNVTYLTNVTDLFMLFEGAMAAYGGVMQEFEEIQQVIDEYEFFEELR
ncbi:MAG: hypothetical protein JSU91_03120 [Thermoplasmatales archaeon]|nr:MAG: hypothetical protein JSU91_03120 [Thermoplasmatales archaeon]